MLASSAKNSLISVKKVATAHGRAIKLDIMEIRQPETSAAVVAQMVAEGLEKRMPFRRVMKQTVEKVMAVRDIVGVRIVMSGRLGGADMSRTEADQAWTYPASDLPCKHRLRAV